MPRLMSVSLTEDAVRERRKTVTRRLGWYVLKPGNRLTLCRKVMGRRAGEPLVQIVDVLVTDVRRERLDTITPDEVELEGFTGWEPDQFIEFFCHHMHCRPDIHVARIEWRYLEYLRFD